MRLADLTALVLAGGLGTRLRDVISDVPKVLAPVAGQPFLVHLLTYLRRWGIRDIVLCIGYKGEMIQEKLGDGTRWGVQIRYSQETRPLGTGGAIRNAEPLITSDPFLVLNGDSFIEADLQEFLDFHLSHCASLSILLTQVSRSNRFGSVVLGEDGQVRAFREKAGRSGWINAGIYLMNRSVLASMSLGERMSLEYDAFPSYVGKGLHGMRCDGRFIDIGTPASYRRAQEVLGRP